MSEETKESRNAVEPDYYEDEISLVDLIGVLFRRKWIIIAGTLLLAVLAGGYAFIQTPKYTASSMLEIGQLSNPDEGGYEKIETSEAIKNRLQSLGQTVGRQLQQELDTEDSEEKLGFSIKNDFRIELPEQGNIVNLEIEAPQSSHALGFLENLGGKLIKQHNRIFTQEKTSIQNQIQRLNIQNQNIDTDIKDLKNQIKEIKRNYESKTGQKQNTIARITNTIDDLEEQKNFLQERIGLLEEERKDLKERVDLAEKRYSDFLNHKMEANDRAGQSAAIGLMLFTSELQQMRRYRDQMRDRLLFNIPEQISKLNTDLKELNSNIHNRKEELELENKLLSQLEPEMEDRIAKVQGQIQAKKNKQEENRLNINGLEVKLDNMIATQVLLEPVYSEEPVSPNIKLNAALGIVLGFFLSVFGAFLVEFWENNKELIVR